MSKIWIIIVKYRDARNHGVSMKRERKIERDSDICGGRLPCWYDFRIPYTSVSPEPRPRTIMFSIQASDFINFDENSSENIP